MNLEETRKHAEEEKSDKELIFHLFYNGADEERVKKELNDFLMSRDMGLTWYPKLIE